MRRPIVPVTLAIATMLIVAMAAPSFADKPVKPAPPAQSTSASFASHKPPSTAECDPIDQSQCLLPFPDDFFTVGDRAAATGLRLNFPRAVMPASPRFAMFRDHRPSKNPAIEARRKAMDRIFADLAPAHVSRKSLYLAWDFTVASARGLAGSMLHMRDDAYAQLGTGVPAFHVSTVDENVSTDVLRRVRGTFDVPQYLTGSGSPGSRLALGADGLPVRTGTFHAEFRCIIPRSVVGADGRAVPARAIVYGHGLLGGTSEIEGSG